MSLSNVRTLCVCVRVCGLFACVCAEIGLNVDWLHNVWRINKKLHEPVVSVFCMWRGKV